MVTSLKSATRDISHANQNTHAKQVTHAKLTFLYFFSRKSLAWRRVVLNK